MPFCIKLARRSPATGTSADAVMRDARTGFGLVREREVKAASAKRSLLAGNSAPIAAASLPRGDKRGGSPLMRRAGHIRERSPGSFELRYELGTNPATGKRRTATVTVRGTRKEAERELRRLLRSLDTGEHVDPSRITVSP